MIKSKWGVHVCAACVALVLGGLSTAQATQKVYIDFDSIKDAFDATGPGPGIPPADEIYDYSVGQRDFIVDFLNINYGPYAVEFFEGPRPIAELTSASEFTLNKGFGAGSDGNDFRNQDNDDEAFGNIISIFKFLGKTSGDWTDGDVMIASANIIGHEVSHLLGARHHDALNPLNAGLGGGIFSGDFAPGYPGPSAAAETGSTFMSQHAGGSLSFESVTEEKVISERLIPRLIVAGPDGDDYLTDEVAIDNHSADLAKAQEIVTPFFATPYPLRPPLPPGATEEPIGIAGVVATVTGELDADPGGGGGFLADYYKFEAEEGQMWTIEAMSYIIVEDESPRYADNADVAIILLDEFGSVVPYYSGTAINDDDDDSGGTFLGASLIDVIIPETGTYMIEVIAAAPFLDTGKDGTDGGSYELFLYSAEVLSVPIPEPASALMLIPGLAWIARRPRR